jgi:hypothetical protein
MMASASAVLQLRTQFLWVLSRPIKTLKKPFESLQSAAEPRQGAFRHLHRMAMLGHFEPRCLLGYQDLADAVCD